MVIRLRLEHQRARISGRSARLYPLRAVEQCPRERERRIADRTIEPNRIGRSGSEPRTFFVSFILYSSLTLPLTQIVVGETLYSPLLLSSTSSNYTSSAGESLSITTNSSGTYVVSGGISSAKISQSDVLIENGVIHVIDGVLLNVDTNEAAASSA